MKRQTIIIAALLGIILLSQNSCSKANDEGSHAAKTKDVQDIYTMSLRPDGHYDVRCRDNRLEIRSADEIRNGQVCVMGSELGPLLCTSRDNDGRDPWVFATITSGGSSLKFPGTTFSTNNDCRESIRTSKKLHSKIIACISRDNDGRDPWVAANIDVLNGSAVKIPELVYNSLAECSIGINAAKQVNDGLVMCTSRDNDGRQPYTVSLLNQQGVSQKLSDLIYDTSIQCESSLNAAKQAQNGLFICASRDKDGRDPWALFRIANSATTRLDFNYSTLDQCLNGQ